MYKRRRVSTEFASPHTNSLFRSPLRVSPPSPNISDSTNAEAELAKSSPLHTPTNTPTLPHSCPSTILTVHTPSQSRSAIKKSFSSPLYGRLPSSTQRDSDPELAALLHQRASLERDISDTKKKIETARTALKYEQKNEDAKLEELVLKWRHTAQKAAEEIFITAKLRVDRMGGMVEFRRLQGLPPRNWPKDKPWRNPNFFNDDREEACDDEAELDREKDEDQEEEEDEEEEEFSMAFMLQMMGIQEKLIGWDPELNNFRKVSL